MSIFKKSTDIVWAVCQLGSAVDDNEQNRFQKAILTLTALIIAFLAIFWGSLYVYIGYPLSGAIPLSYAVISFISIKFFFITKRFEFFRFSQFLLIFLLPFLLMWSLGGFANGSVVMVWAFFAPLAAIFFADKKQMARWVVAFIVFTLISGFIDPYVKNWAQQMDTTFNTLFFVMNMGAGFISIYFIIMSFVNDREESNHQAIQAKEEALVAQKKLQKANEKLQDNEEIIRKMMMTDELTGIPNRRHMEEKMKEEFNRVNRFGQPLALVIADIDNFKSINDDFGHAIGDQVLKVFSQTMVDVIREIDFIARIGGEEFILLFPDTQVSSVEKIIYRLQERLDSVELDKIKRKVTASFGVAIAKKDESGHDCLKRADIALYTSKKKGRNRITFA